MKTKKSDNELVLEAYNKKWASNAFRAFYNLLKCEIKEEQKKPELLYKRDRDFANHFIILDVNRLNKLNEN